LQGCPRFTQFGIFLPSCNPAACIPGRPHSAQKQLGKYSYVGTGIPWNTFPDFFRGQCYGPVFLASFFKPMLRCLGSRQPLFVLYFSAKITRKSQFSTLIDYSTINLSKRLKIWPNTLWQSWRSRSYQLHGDTKIWIPFIDNLFSALCKNDKSSHLLCVWAWLENCIFDTL
jgi:hypothetical protein